MSSSQEQSDSSIVNTKTSKIAEIVHFYIAVFLKRGQKERDWEPRSLRMNDVLRRYGEQYSKPIASSAVKRKYLEPLISLGWINIQNSNLDKRLNWYYAVRKYPDVQVYIKANNIIIEPVV